MPAATSTPTTTAERDDERGPIITRPGALTVASAVAVMAVTVGVAWWTTRLGGGTLTALLTIALAGGGAIAVSVIGRRSGAALRHTAVVITLVVGAVILQSIQTGSLAAMKVRSDVGAWTAEAERLLAEPPLDHVCSAAPLDPPQLAGFGRVDEWCVSRGSRSRSVSFMQRDPMGGWTGLLYNPDSPEPTLMSQCVAHLDGPWWQTASAIPDCPGGFTFRGGG